MIYHEYVQVTSARQISRTTLTVHKNVSFQCKSDLSVAFYCILFLWLSGKENKMLYTFWSCFLHFQKHMSNPGSMYTLSPNVFIPISTVFGNKYAFGIALTPLASLRKIEKSKKAIIACS